MKSFIKIILLLLLPAFSIAQKNPYWEELTKEQIDSLRLVLKNTSNDTLRMGIARSFGFYYMELKGDSALYFLDRQLVLAKQLKLKLWEADALDNIGYVSSQLKNYPRSLQAFLEGLKIAEDKESEKNIWRISKFSKEGNPRNARLTVLALVHQDMGTLYGNTGNFEKQVSNCLEALKIAESVNDQSLLSIINMNLGMAYMNLNKLDSALAFEQKALDYTNTSGFQINKGRILFRIGNIYFKKGNYALAKEYFSEAIQESQQQYNLLDLAEASVRLANLFSFTGNRDSSLWYVKKGLEIFQSTGSSPDGLVNAYTTLSSIYKLRNNLDSAFIYQGLAMIAKDSLNNVEKIKQFQNIGFDEQLRLRELEEEKIQVQNKIRIYALLASIVVFILIAFLLLRNNRNRRKANTLLEKQKEELQSTLAELKSTQAQLIQSEKMASLGELTAGIAHEIQNPLNFVNNFSEVNKELLIEMENELTAGNNEEAISIAKDVIENEEKINHHGKRADAIVKGMLQHSRSSSGVKEPTDINALADEYLRLSYHGLRAKDKSFNATIQTDFDQTIGKINIIPQDIGRVLLNLYNNAFYAVAEKKKQQSEGYEPTVSVSTKKLNNKVEISVRDNGNGIPQKVVDKIFQPFFTTKPTGQGTGLGLSLSYDIVKADGGEIRVHTTEGEFAEFVIQLPIVV
jgi:two-component system, NtrC family, sensor kinase